MNDELTAADIQRLLTGEIETIELRSVVRRLLKGCPPAVLAFNERQLDFLREVAEIPDLPETPLAAGWAYDAVVGKAEAQAPRLAKRFDEARERLTAGLAAMRACPGGWRALPKQEQRKLRGWVRLEMLWEAAFAVRYSDPGDMLGMTIVARKLAAELPEEEHGAAFVADCQARACAELGNAWRVNVQLVAAEQEFVEAWKLFEDGSGDLELKARLNSLEASLRRDQRRIPEALALLQEAQVLYRELKNQHLAGRTLIQKAQVLHDEGRVEEAVPVYREALALLDRERDPELVATTLQSLINTLAECGDFHEAGSLLLKSDLRKAFADQPLNLLKLRWAEAKILLARGDDERGIEILHEVRQELARREQHYDAALVALDEAAFWLAEGATDAVRNIAEEAYETFEMLAVSSEATKALYFLYEACRRDLLTAQIFTAVRSFFLRVQHDPRARFEAPG